MAFWSVLLTPHYPVMKEVLEFIAVRLLLLPILDPSHSVDRKGKEPTGLPTKIFGAWYDMALSTSIPIYHNPTDARVLCDRQADPSRLRS
jgi:hypothetical protein